MNTIEDRRYSMRCVAFSPTSKAPCYLLFRRSHLPLGYDNRGGAERAKFKDPTHDTDARYLFGVCISPNDDMVVSVHGDRTIRFWNIATRSVKIQRSQLQIWKPFFASSPNQNSITFLLDGSSIALILGGSFNYGLQRQKPTFRVKSRCERVMQIQI